MTDEPAPFEVVDGTLVIGGRLIRWAQLFQQDQPIPPSPPPLGDPAPRSFKTRRARIPFENSWAVSVAWGSATYSSNYDHPLGGAEFTETPAVVELAVLGRAGLLGDVRPWLGADEVLAVIDAVATWPSGYGVHSEAP